MSLLSFDDRDGTIWMDGTLVDGVMPKRMFLAMGCIMPVQCSEANRFIADRYSSLGIIPNGCTIPPDSGLQDPLRC